MPQSRHWIVRRLSHLDGILLALVLLLLGISLAVVASASGQSPARISGHLVNIGLALSVMVVMANVPPHLLSKVGPPLYAAGSAAPEARGRNYWRGRADSTRRFTQGFRPPETSRKPTRTDGGGA